jgi:hypothetical protein
MTLPVELLQHTCFRLSVMLPDTGTSEEKKSPSGGAGGKSNPGNWTVSYSLAQLQATNQTIRENDAIMQSTPPGTRNSAPSMLSSEPSFDPETGMPISRMVSVKEEVTEDAPLFDPETGMPLKPAAGARQHSETLKFDPETGMPIESPSGGSSRQLSEMPKFDPETGLPMESSTRESEAPRFDPETGLLIKIESPVADAAARENLARFDPETGLPIRESAAQEPADGVPRFDPETGLPINAPSQSSHSDVGRETMPRFDPETGRPMLASATDVQGGPTPIFDPETGKPFGAPPLKHVPSLDNAMSIRKMNAARETLFNTAGNLLPGQRCNGLQPPAMELACAYQSDEEKKLAQQAKMYQVHVSHRARSWQACKAGSGEDNILFLFGRSVWRSFNDFEWLHKMLVGPESVVGLPEEEQKGLPDLPKLNVKETFYKALGASAAEQVMVKPLKLEGYLSALYRHYKIRQHPVFLLFTCGDYAEFQEARKTPSFNSWAGLPKLRSVIESFQAVERESQGAIAAHINYMQYATEEMQLQLRLRELDRRAEQQEGRKIGLEHRLKLHQQRLLQHTLSVEEALPIRRAEDSKVRAARQAQRLAHERARFDQQDQTPTLHFIDREVDNKSRESEHKAREQLRAEFNEGLEELKQFKETWTLDDMRRDTEDRVRAQERGEPNPGPWTLIPHEWFFRHRGAVLPSVSSLPGPLQQLESFRERIAEGMPLERSRLEDEGVRAEQERDSLEKEKEWDNHNQNVLNAERGRWDEEDQRLRAEQQAIQRERALRSQKESVVEEHVRRSEMLATKHEEQQAERVKQRTMRKLQAKDFRVYRHRQLEVATARLEAETKQDEMLIELIQQMQQRVSNSLRIKTLLVLQVKATAAGTPHLEEMEAGDYVVDAGKVRLHMPHSESREALKQDRQAHANDRQQLDHRLTHINHEKEAAASELQQAKVPYDRTQHEDEDNIHPADQPALEFKRRRLKVDHRFTESRSRLAEEGDSLLEEIEDSRRAEEELGSKDGVLNSEALRIDEYDQRLNLLNALVSETCFLQASKKGALLIAMQLALARQSDRRVIQHEREEHRRTLLEQQRSLMSNEIPQLMQLCSQRTDNLSEDSVSNSDQLQQSVRLLEGLEGLVVACLDHAKSQILDINALQRDKQRVKDTWHSAKLSANTEMQAIASVAEAVGQRRAYEWEKTLTRAFNHWRDTHSAEVQQLHTGWKEWYTFSKELPEIGRKLQMLISQLLAEAQKLSQARFVAQTRPLSEQQSNLLAQDPERMNPQISAQLQGVGKQLAQLQRHRNGEQEKNDKDNDSYTDRITNACLNGTPLRPVSADTTRKYSPSCTPGQPHASPCAVPHLARIVLPPLLYDDSHRCHSFKVRQKPPQLPKLTAATNVLGYHLQVCSRRVQPSCAAVVCICSRIIAG